MTITILSSRVKAAPPSVKLARRYDDAAERWNRKLRRLGYIDAYAALVSHAQDAGLIAPTASTLRVLDAGAGAGAFSLALAQARAGSGATGPVCVDLLDVSPAMLACAVRTLAPTGFGCRPMLGALGATPLADGACDVVLCGHLLEHLDDPVAGLRALRRALRPGGALLLAANKPHWCTRLLRLRWGSRAFAPAVMLAHLAAAGFGPVTQVAFAAGPPARTSRGYVALA